MQYGTPGRNDLRFCILPSSGRAASNRQVAGEIPAAGTIVSSFSVCREQIRAPSSKRMHAGAIPVTEATRPSATRQSASVLTRNSPGANPGGRTNFSA